ncbi:MAG TPA: hypothetical protein VGS19_31685 [Streptosporangiaceae bacterium]|nr:hypothetical protein [Streptosporangiaceae bacterium]
MRFAFPNDLYSARRCPRRLLQEHYMQYPVTWQFELLVVILPQHTGWTPVPGTCHGWQK